MEVLGLVIEHRLSQFCTSLAELSPPLRRRAFRTHLILNHGVDTEQVLSDNSRDPDLEQRAGVVLTQVNVDHLQQPLDFVVAHLAVLVLIRSPQVASDPSADIKSRGKTSTIFFSSFHHLHSVLYPLRHTVNVSAMKKDCKFWILILYT